MPPLDFPNAPTLNQTYTGPNNTVWSWDGAKWLPASLSGTGYAPTLSPVFTGNPTAPTPPGGDNDTSVATTAFVAPAFNNAGRNLLHNPLFNVAQRGVGPFSGFVYTADRWGGYSNLDVTTVAINPISGTPPGVDEAAKNTLYCNFAGNAGAASSSQIYQMVEDVRRLSGKTVTISFWASASATPKLGVSFTQNFGTGGSPSASVVVNGQVVTLSTAWVRYSLTFALPSASGKVIGTSNNDNTQMIFWYSAGPTNNTQSGGVGVQTGQINLWGVQLEVGSVATPLEKPDPRYDLANCQRFFSILTGFMAIATSGGAGTGIYGIHTYPQTMRAVPTITPTGISYANASALTVAQGPADSCTMQATASGGGTAWAGATLQISADL